MLALSQQQIVGEKASCVTCVSSLLSQILFIIFCLRLMSERKGAACQRRFSGWIRPELFASVEKTHR
jgi:hypothetical protein